MPKKSAAPFVLSEALLSAFDTNDRINQYLLENVPAEAWRAEDASRIALREVLHAALESDGRIKGFRPDVAGFVGYLIAHDAHHRGQIAMLARQTGHALPQKAMFGMWEWGVR